MTGGSFIGGAHIASDDFVCREPDEGWQQYVEMGAYHAVRRGV